MTSSDGGQSFSEGVGILLVRCGEVLPDLVDRLAAEVSRIVDQMLPPDCSRPGISIASSPDPVIACEQSGEWEPAFQAVLRDVAPSSFTILITGQGLWHTDPLPRFIFAHVFGNGAAVLSLRRFRPPWSAAMQGRLKKEIIKVVGMALGMHSCPDDRCIMSHHWTPEDLDRNAGVCPGCREFVATTLVDRILVDRNAEE